MERILNKLKAKKSVVLPLYAIYLTLFNIILGFGISDIWDRLVAWSNKEN